MNFWPEPANHAPFVQLNTYPWSAPVDGYSLNDVLTLYTPGSTIIAAQILEFVQAVNCFSNFYYLLLVFGYWVTP